MAERTMEELLQAPTEGYREAIILLEINADHFEIKTNLLQLVQANPFYGRESENPHAHINSFKGIPRLRFRNVPKTDVIKLMMFPYSLDGSCQKLGTKKRTTKFNLAWEDLEANGLNKMEQDSLNARGGGNLLMMNATSSKTDERIDKLADQLSTLVEIVSKKVVTPAPVKAVEETCVTCGGAHSCYKCTATDNNQAVFCATTGTVYNQVNPPNRVSNQMAQQFCSDANNGQNRFNQNLVSREINFNRGNNIMENQRGSGNRNREETDKEQTNFQGSTAQIPPPVIPISIPEPDVPKTLPKTTPIPESDISAELLRSLRFAHEIKKICLVSKDTVETEKIARDASSKKLPEKHLESRKILIPCNLPEWM
ncbi:hypothetical protein Tco_0150132 [Tanacetum coccineum]